MKYMELYGTSPVGLIQMESDGVHLTGLWIEGQDGYDVQDGLAGMAKNNLPASLPVFAQTRSWLDRYFSGMDTSPYELPLAPAGSDFRQAVWKILCTIPRGQVVTYGDIAAELAKQRGIKAMSAQAVGGAVGKNPISIIIPCHRVTGAGGNLTGYGGGLAKKIKLLELEGVDMSRFHLPGNLGKSARTSL